MKELAEPDPPNQPDRRRRTYASVVEVPPGETLEPLLVAPLAVRLADLDLA